MIFRKKDSLEINEVNDGYILYDCESEIIHFLNNSAMTIFDLCDGVLTPMEISEIIKDLFGLPESPEKIVIDSLQEMFQKGLIIKWEKYT